MARFKTTHTAAQRKYKDMQAYFARRAAITEKIGNRPVRKYSDDRVIAEIMHKFYYDSPKNVWAILKKKLD